MATTSQNPILKEALNALNTAPQQPADAPLQYADVIVKSGGLLAIGVIAAIPGWLILASNPLLILLLSLGALGVAVASAFKKTPGPALPLLYAVLQGAVIGGISALFAANYGNDIITTAVLATVAVFITCLIVFRIPAVRNSTQGRRIFLIALIAYLALSVISLIAGVFFGVGDGWGFYGLGLLGIGIAVGATLLSAWSLVVDFGDIDRAVTAGVPERYSWQLALGLYISIVWLYLNLLRLLALTRN